MEGGREWKKHQCVVASHAYSTGDLAHDPGICPDWELSQQPFDLQASTQPLSYTGQGIPFPFLGTLDFWTFMTSQHGNLASLLGIWAIVLFVLRGP